MKSPIDQFNAVFKSEKQNICSDRYNYLIEGKTYCFTSAGWWRKWWDFVNIECKSYFQIKDENLHQSHIDFAKWTGDEDGELDSRFSDVQWVEEDIKQQQPKQLKFIEDDNFYSRPGKIVLILPYLFRSIRDLSRIWECEILQDRSVGAQQLTFKCKVIHYKIMFQ